MSNSRAMSPGRSGASRLLSPGSQVGLLPPSPLRTARESFPSSSSSISKGPLQNPVALLSSTFTIPICCRRALQREAAPATYSRHLLCFLSRFLRLSRDETPEGSQPACAWGIDPYPFHYRAAFASSLLPYPHANQLPLRVAFPYGRRVGLPRSMSVPSNGLGPASSPVALCLRAEKGELLPHATCRFGSSLSAPLAGSF